MFKQEVEEDELERRREREERERERETYPGIVGDERMWSSRRSAVGRKEVRFGDERVVAFVIDSRMDEPAVRAPSTVSCKKMDSSASNRAPGSHHQTATSENGR